MKRLLLPLLALASTPALAQTIAITGGKVVIGDGSAPIDSGTVVVSNGRIVAAGSNVAIPSGAQRIDATGKWVTPGIVAGFSRIGLAGVDAVDESNDTSAKSSPFSAALDIALAVSPDVEAISVNRAAGAASTAGCTATAVVGNWPSMATSPMSTLFWYMRSGTSAYWPSILTGVGNARPLTVTMCSPGGR